MTQDQLKRGNEINALLVEKRTIASEMQKAKQLFAAGTLTVGTYTIPVVATTASTIIDQAYLDIMNEISTLEAEFNAL
jgi:hypothetical protein